MFLPRDGKPLLEIELISQIDAGAGNISSGSLEPDRSTTNQASNREWARPTGQVVVRADWLAMVPELRLACLRVESVLPRFFLHRLLPGQTISSRQGHLLGQKPGYLPGNRSRSDRSTRYAREKDRSDRCFRATAPADQHQSARAHFSNRPQWRLDSGVR